VGANPSVHTSTLGIGNLMISDSPYRFRDAVLSPGRGIFAGGVGSLLMLGLLVILEPLSGLSPAHALEAIGVACPWDCGGSSPVARGITVHLIMGALLGLLYAASQQRIPVRGLVGVGIFYGVLLWAVGGLIVGSFLGESLRRVIRSWP